MAFIEIVLVTYLTLFSTGNGCGQLPQRQGRTINFEVTNFKLPARMVYIEDSSAPSKVSTISTSEQQAVTFVQNVIMQSVADVLYQQGRGAGLSDDVITLILNQMDISVKYVPLKCDIIFTDLAGAMIVMPDKVNCQIIDKTVTKTCSKTAPLVPPNNPHMMCPPASLEEILPIHLTISGSITTTNIIMANWSTSMWQSVVNRALRSLTSGPLGSQFVGASINLK